jgi:Sec-independent protein secretion pathway component TatC
VIITSAVPDIFRDYPKWGKIAQIVAKIYIVLSIMFAVNGILNAIVAILAVAAIVTPPDVFSQLILFAAIYPLYEISIFLIARFEKQRDAQLRAEGVLEEGESLYGEDADESPKP